MVGRGDSSTRAFARLAALVAGVLAMVTALRALRPERLPDRTAASGSGDPTIAIVVLALLAGSSLLLLVLARLRFPPARPPRLPAEPLGLPRRAWVGGLLLLVVILGVAWVPWPRLADPRVGSDEPEAPPEVPDADVPVGVTAGAGPWLAVGLLFVLAAIAVLGMRRRTAEFDPGGGAVPTSGARADESTPLAAAAAAALSVVEGQAATPREAIIGCYVAMERALARSSGASPRAADTPSEVLGRAADAGVLRAEHAWPLVNLFDEARFSAHPMTSAHQKAAVAALRTIVTDLRSEPW